MLNKFQEVQVLLKRANEHLDWLREYVIHPEPDLIPANEGYDITPEAFDLITAKIRITIGEFASCLRNSLNYLPCLMAKQDSPGIGKQVQFPIESIPENFASNRNRFLKGVDNEHLAFFERLQPYNTPGESWLALLQALANWYRHNGLINVEKVFQRPRVPTVPTETEWYGGTSVEVRRAITFGVTLEGGRPVIKTLEELHRRTRETVNEFKPMLSLD